MAFTLTEYYSGTVVKDVCRNVVSFVVVLAPIAPAFNSGANRRDILVRVRVIHEKNPPGVAWAGFLTRENRKRQTKNVFHTPRCFHLAYRLHET